MTLKINCFLVIFTASILILTDTRGGKIQISPPLRVERLGLNYDLLNNLKNPSRTHVHEGCGSVWHPT